eukprot:1157803-Pelagomonas_calceolata.AAC.5
MASALLAIVCNLPQVLAIAICRHARFGIDDLDFDDVDEFGDDCLTLLTQGAHKQTSLRQVSGYLREHQLFCASRIGRFLLGADQFYTGLRVQRSVAQSHTAWFDQELCLINTCVMKDTVPYGIV